MKRSSCTGARIGLGAGSESLGISDGSLAAWVKEIDAADEPGALDADERR